MVAELGHIYSGNWGGAKSLSTKDWPRLRAKMPAVPGRLDLVPHVDCTLVADRNDVLL
jgi:hypothetical protein